MSKKSQSVNIHSSVFSHNLVSTVGAVYDTTICYRGPKMPSIMGVVNAEPCAADICVRRFPISEIPRESDEELAQWLINLYKEKVGSSFTMAHSHCYILSFSFIS